MLCSGYLDLLLQSSGGLVELAQAAGQHGFDDIPNLYNEVS